MIWMLTAFGAALVLLLLWMAMRWYSGWSPGQGSPAPGVTYQVFPSATPCSASSGNVAAAAANASLPAAANKITYIEGFDITGLGATAASNISVTITGLATQCGTPTYTINIPAGVLLQVNASSPNGGYSYRFPTPLPGSALNTAVVVNVPSFGTGNTNACTTAYGFQA